MEAWDLDSDGDEYRTVPHHTTAEEARDLLALIAQQEADLLAWVLDQDDL
ncbi:hypothetical protein [Amycolatopsis sp. Poz14]|nr:hypothetical protein [Amycolatopsis sp. Poz14]MCG3756683.1 hypothetical protein [Amycolatopsis sp. Poz14]